MITFEEFYCIFTLDFQRCWWSAVGFIPISGFYFLISWYLLLVYYSLLGVYFFAFASTFRSSEY